MLKRKTATAATGEGPPDQRLDRFGSNDAVSDVCNAASGAGTCAGRKLIELCFRLCVMCACVCECTGLCIRIRWSVKCTSVLRAVVAEVFFINTQTYTHTHTQSDELHFKYMSLGFDLSCKIVNLMRGLKRGNRCKKPRHR